MLDYFINYFINLDFKITYPITNVLECISIVFMLTPFERTKKYFFNRAIDIIVVFSAYLFLGSLYYMLFGDAGHKFFMVVVYSIIIGIYAAFRSKLKVVVRVINSFFLLSTFILLVEISGAAGYLILNTFDIDIISIDLLINVLILLVDVIIVNLIPFNNEENVSPLNVVVMIFITFIILITQLFELSDFNEQLFRCIVFISFWIIDLLTYYMSYHLTHKQNANLALVTELRQRENIENLTQVSEQNIRKIQEFKHDEKNKFFTLKMLLEKGQLNEAKKFFDEMEIDLQSLSIGKRFIDCGNNMLNAIINIEDAKAEFNGVKLDVNLLVPRVITIEDNDLCSLLMNIIDNAIEATVTAKNKTIPVSVNVKLVNDSLFIRVSNVAEDREEERLSLKTTKKEKQIHGYGTKIIDKIIRKYGGVIERNFTDGIFTVDAMLQLRGVEE